ncbi:MAG: acid phosphatase family membrane protein YuiD [Planctomycetota bacterium]|jgi:acid phosphatase family membrane protein YuiD
MDSDGYAYPMHRASHQILASVLAACLLSSCVTATVWGGGVEEDEDGSSSIVFTGGTPLSSSSWVNALVTPFALALDLCLSPVQAFLYGWDDDDDDGC